MCSGDRSDTAIDTNEGDTGNVDKFKYGDQTRTATTYGSASFIWPTSSGLLRPDDEYPPVQH